ncbi:MAG TPA: TraB/GumN family protein [bacterium]|jgi:pheromone shutdown-related protein TraB|nr:TraB/GumN family protein [bacterium]
MSLKFVSVSESGQNLHKIEFEGGKVLYLIGTAHVSGESVQLVENTINEYSPDTVAVELDENRLEVLKNRKRYEETDIFEIFRKGKVLFFSVQLMLTSYQKKIAEKTGVAPGTEFKKAVQMAEEKGLKLVNADRDISITLKRTIRSMTFTEKAKFLGGLFLSDDKDVTNESIEELKKGDMLMQLIGEMGDEFPSVKRVILDERDKYLAVNIMKNLGNTTVAVVGAAHVPGIISHLQNEKTEGSDLSEIEYIPPASKVTKLLPWLIPAIIIFMFIWGFINGDSSTTMEAAIYWILINGVLSALGCIIALGHPLTVLAGFIAAPITSLNPTIGAGMVTGLVQLYLVKPTVKDLENASSDTLKLKGWWSNRLTRALLVSLFSSIGSSIGTFAAFPFLMKILL